jgi:hypothetical protein
MWILFKFFLNVMLKGNILKIINKKITILNKFTIINKLVNMFQNKIK